MTRRRLSLANMQIVRGRIRDSLTADWWNRNLPDRVRIRPLARWPLILLPFLIVLQLISPAIVWLVLVLAVVGLYAAGYAWVREQAQHVDVQRQRQGTVLVAGDVLIEEFTLVNESALPVLWAELADDSDLPDYRASQVVSCGARNRYRWRVQAQCRQRGIFQLGPHRLLLGDPFGLFRVQIRYDRSEVLLIYPRVVHLPHLDLPRGMAGGRDRRRRPLSGTLRSASVREYQAGDSLRYIHWPTTAHRGRLTVTELESEPSGDLWIVLDLNQTIQHGEGDRSTLEYGVVLAASLAAELLRGGERRAVGLLAATGAEEGDGQMILLPPQPGQAQLWQIMAALAQVRAGKVSLARLLHRSREVLGQARTVAVITPDLGLERLDGHTSPAGWISELVHLQQTGLFSSTLLVIPAEEDEERTGLEEKALAVRGLLARQDIPVQMLQVGTPLQAALTYRRRRTVVRTTPTGGVVTFEVEEEVG